jgi:uncharacterized cupin superfamily protein
MDSVPFMSNLPTPAPLIIVPSGDGESVHAFGTEMLFHLTGKQTAGRSAVGTSIVPAHSPGPPPHYHEREDEIFFVQEGRMALRQDSGDERFARAVHRVGGFPTSRVRSCRILVLVH